MVSDAAKMSHFINTSISFLRGHGFDGLDLDWEYPALRNGANPNTDKKNFGTLCKVNRIKLICILITKYTKILKYWYKPIFRMKWYCHQL